MVAVIEVLQMLGLHDGRLPLPLEPLGCAGDSDRLVHDPFSDAEILLHVGRDDFGIPGLEFLRFEGQAGRPPHSSQESRQQDRIEGVMGQAPKYHCGGLFLAFGCCLAKGVFDRGEGEGRRRKACARSMRRPNRRPEVVG